MKHLTTLLLSVYCLLGAACKKESNPSSIEGRWNLTETYTSTGGATDWKPVTDKRLTELVEFKANGVYSSSRKLDFDRYQVTDSVTLVLFSSVVATQPKYFYRFKLTNNSLELSPTAPYICTDGCTARYTRTK